MGIVSAGFTMSLDGFIAGPNDDVGLLFKWYFGGDVSIPAPDSGMVFKVAAPSVPIIQELLGSFGAIVTGRRDFEVSNAWGGKSPIAGAPIFIVTHNPPQEWLNKESPFTFVTDGVESALNQARKVAGDKNIAVGGTTITRQMLEAGLLDEIHIDLVPLLLGDGIRLFDHLSKPIELVSKRVIDSTGVTHLTFRVLKQ
jgi:dihydrofolate reductase